MLRILLLPSVILTFLSVASWADDVDDCRNQKDKSVEDAQNEYQRHKGKDAARSAAAGQNKPNVPNSAKNLKGLASQNVTELSAAIANNKDRIDQCKEKCKPKANDPNQGLKIFYANECERLVNDETAKAEHDLAENSNAVPESEKTQKASEDTKKPGEKNQASSGTPQVPQMQQASKDKEEPKTDQAKNETPPTTQTASAAPPPVPRQEGKAGFKQSSTKSAATAASSTCTAAMAKDGVVGCEGYGKIADASGAVAPSNKSASGASAGGGSTGGGGGGINAASVAAALAANQQKLGETEKDGKNTGLKAASLNLGTDGGGGGGGAAASGGVNLGDFDLGLNKGLSPDRGPSSAVAGMAAADAKLFKMGIAPERFPVVKIVENTYEKRCQMGLMLHCGKNP